MSSVGSVNAEQLVRALSRRQVTLPAEIGTFLILEACEHMLASGPTELASLVQLLISQTGDIALSGPSCDDEHAARCLHRAHAALLAAAGSALTPALQRLVREGPRGAFLLGNLRDELEASLVPLNRNASRRVLTRLVREAAHASIAREDVDAALNTLLGVGDEPANDVAAQSVSSWHPSDTTGERSALQVDLFEGLELGDSDADFARGVDLAGEGQAIGASSRRRHDSSGRIAVLRAASGARASRDSSHTWRVRAEDLVESAGGGLPNSRKLFAGLALMGLAVAVVMLALSVRSTREFSPLVLVPPSNAGAPSAVFGDLIVHVSEPNAQVLRLVGRAPLEVEHLPIGVPHEFVATASGYRPARVLVPADADWEATAEGARYEVALQLDDAVATPEAELELGPSRLVAPGTERPARQGAVRVVTTPRGARVYQLIGFSPEIRVEGFPIAEAQELLVYRERYRPVVRAVAPSDFQEREGRRVAELTIELAERRP